MRVNMKILLVGGLNEAWVDVEGPVGGRGFQRCRSPAPLRSSVGVTFRNDARSLGDSVCLVLLFVLFRRGEGGREEPESSSLTILSQRRPLACDLSVCP